MQLEFRKAPRTWSNGTDLQNFFAIEYRYSDDEDWYELEDFNEKVAEIIVEALTKYQEQNALAISTQWSKVLKNDN
ncbi:MAG: hypothetical protein IM526_02505 [Microcystis sp. M38BS1]|uniref:hypothetical protein n=1 Tax=Microcystis sp. M38BS1 TaxID=2771188 RepID=UPI0031FD278D|nr:hypothetical protein [Microcystis sp. M38BS1]MCA6582530.1 hypothetical protein [Pseudanabaena sp. M34BS1SP1A06MG]